jgi:type IX secretion system PorP/SprF family membrane protein
MKKILISTALVIIVGLGNTMAQQIPLFNSYTLNQFLLNPSYAGANGKTNIYGINRIQYAGFAGAPVTYMMTADAGIKDKKMGVGGVLFSDRNTLLSQNGFQLSYAYTIKLSEKWNIGMGLNAGMLQWTLNFDQLKVDDPNEAFLSNYRSNATTFRSDVGLRLSSDKIDFGLSLPQVVSSKVKYSDYLKNSEGNYTSIPHYIVNLSYLLTLNNDIKVKPMLVARGAKGLAPQIDVIGLLDYKNKAYATLGYRTGYAVTIGGGLKLAKGITIGYAYDKPVNNISQYSSGSHEFVVGITIGGNKQEEDKPEPSNALTKEAELKLKADLEKQIQEKISQDLEKKMKQELDARINKAVDEKIAKALESIPSTPTTPSTDGKTAPTTGNATVSKEDLEKIKKDIEEKIRKQMDETYSKLIDEKIKKAIDSKPNTPVSTGPSKEETDKLRKDIEDKLRKELVDKINSSVEEKLAIESQKAKDEASKTPPKESNMTAKDKAVLDSMKKVAAENQKRIAELEKIQKAFPEKERIENKQLLEIKRIVRANDLELKEFKAQNRVILDAAKDAPSKKTTKAEESEEPSKFMLILAGFKTIKEAQEYQKLAAQTFEFPGCKIIKPTQIEGWYFVYSKSFDNKKKAWEVQTKMLETEYQTPNFPWIYVEE